VCIHVKEDNIISGLVRIHVKEDNLISSLVYIHVKEDNLISGLVFIHVKEDNLISGLVYIHVKEDNLISGFYYTDSNSNFRENFPSFCTHLDKLGPETSHPNRMLWCFLRLICTHTHRRIQHVRPTWCGWIGRWFARSSQSGLNRSQSLDKQTVLTFIGPSRW